MLNESTDGVKELTNASPNQPRDVFKTENEVDDELVGAQKIKPSDLKIDSFFGRGRNFFISVKQPSDVPEDIAEEQNKALMHYYHLKRLCRSKSQPLYVYQIDPEDYVNDLDVVREKLNIGSIEELQETAYILVNEDRLKLTQLRSQADPAISYKFLQNPHQIHSIDDLYDLLDANKDLPVKYFMMKKQHKAVPKDFTLQSKLFRKFFYENSAAIEDLAIFVEITRPSIASKIGLTGADQICVVQNKNMYNKLKNGTDFKVLNLELERSEPFKEILDETL